MSVSAARVWASEFIGTALLIIGGPGTAVLAGAKVGTAGVAAAFGLSLAAIALLCGPVSGGHVNPAVTLAMVLARKVRVSLVPYYLAGQLTGGLFGAAVIYSVANGNRSFHVAGHFAQNGWGSTIASPYGLAATAVVEIVGTALLVAMALATTRRTFPPAVAPIALGLTLALIHIVTIGVDSTGVNPARSLATAVFAGGDALSQLWAFMVFPAIGSLLGLAVHLVLDDEPPARSPD